MTETTHLRWGGAKFASRLRSVIAGLVVVAGFAQSARAQTVDADALAAATQLTAIISGETSAEMLKQMSDALWPTLETQLRAAKINDDATLADLHSEMDRVTSQYVAKVMAGAPAIYAKHFTAAELREMVAFYGTPVGIKALHEMPAVMGEAAASMAPMMPAMQADITAAVRAVLIKHSTGQAPPARPPT